MQADSVSARALAVSPGEIVLRRLHALSGVIPLGVFLIVHIGTSAAALAGPYAFGRTASAIDRIPLLPVVTLFGIVLPLAFHALYGAKLILDARQQGAPSDDRFNGLRGAQHVSGLVTLAFVGYHLGEFWIPRLLGRLGSDALYPLLATRLSSTALGLPLLALAYLVGISAACFHFTNGLFAFARSAGLLASPRARLTLSFLFVGLGVSVFLLGAATTIYFATGLRLRSTGYDASATDPRCAVIDRASSPPAREPPAQSSSAPPSSSAH